MRSDFRACPSNACSSSYIRGMNLELNDCPDSSVDPGSGPHRAERSLPSQPPLVALKDILGRLRPEPERSPLPPLTHYEPPRFIRGRRRRGS